MERYEVGIIGAGLAGMALAIQLAQGGKRVLIVEKSSYPRHKVCGEFLSKESQPFLQRLGLPMEKWHLPEISELVLSSEKGAIVRSTLEMGGIGISRYKLDHELSKLLDHPLITYLNNTKVDDIDHNSMLIQGRTYTCDLLVAAYGKYHPHFVNSLSSDSKNYIGVKYHIKLDHPQDQIVLHSFKNGYCGMSKVENDISCLCYLADSRLLRSSGSIKKMEKDWLHRNSHLKDVFKNAAFIYNNPLTISNIQFQDKLLFNDELVFVGDAAGAISPLAGNGMSMALHASKILAEEILSNSNDPKNNFANRWLKEFKPRIKNAKLLNHIMLNPFYHHLVLKTLNANRSFKKRIVREMQGNEF